MVLPPEFIDSLDQEARDGFLDHLILTAAGADGYDGDIVVDRHHLLRQLRSGELLVEHAQEEGTFGLITKEMAQEQGYQG